MSVLTPDFSRRLGGELRSRIPAALHDEAAQRAAVAVIVTGEAEPAILFVKRRERSGDPWSGQVAFPGGFAAPGDGSAAETARREAEEETGLDLARIGEELGRLDDVYPRSVHLPRVIVTPVVFEVSARLPANPGSEVEHVVWVEVRELFDRANRKEFVLSLPGGERAFDSIHAGGLVIWGLTERILQQIATLSQ